MRVTSLLIVGLAIGAVNAGECDPPCPDGSPDCEPTPTPIPTPTPTPIPPVDVTFAVDTNTMADGVNRLAYVDTAAGETVYMVGSFNGWDPQDRDFAMTETSPGSGVFSVTITFPYSSYYTDWEPGDETTDFEYLFTKTTADPSEPWSNIMKEFYFGDEQMCSDPVWSVPENEVDDYDGTLWGTGNLMLTTIPIEPVTLPAYEVQAWWYYAESFGYPTCDY